MFRRQSMLGDLILIRTKGHTREGCNHSGRNSSAGMGSIVVGLRGPRNLLATIAKAGHR